MSAGLRQQRRSRIGRDPEDSGPHGGRLVSEGETADKPGPSPSDRSVSGGAAKSQAQLSIERAGVYRMGRSGSE
ncbi:hypothetical protein GCM10027267_11410 [Paramicrobacterium agarici]